MVWGELALLGTGAVLAQGGSLLQRRADRRDRREQRALADESVRAGLAEAQTREALMSVAERLLQLQGWANPEHPEAFQSLVNEALTHLRRQGLLVADQDLRERIEAAVEALDWWRVVDQELHWGLLHLVNVLTDDLAPAIGANLRHEAVPPAGHSVKEYDAALARIKVEPAC